MDSSRRTLAVTCAGTFVTLAAFTMPLVAVAETAEGLGAGTSGRTWILSSMSIGLGAFLLTAGRLADDYGRRRAFVAGAGLMALGAVLGAVAPSVTWFVLARVLQGIGGAALTAASLGVIGHTFTSAAERGRATAAWGASLGAGIAAGPIVAAGLATVHSWRDVYVVLALAALLLALAGRRLEESSSGIDAPPDVPGVLTLVAGLAAVLAGLTEGRQAGWTSPAVVALLAAGLLLLAAFLVVERRSDHPMLEPALFTNPLFVGVTLAALATGGGVIAQLSFFAAFADAALQVSSWTAALMFLAWSATSAVVSLAARRLPDAVTGTTRLAGSLLVVSVGLLLVRGATGDSTVWHSLPGFLVAGLGSGVLNAALGRESVATVPAHQAGLGSGANNTARYLGSALGVTVVSVVAVPAGAVSAPALAAGWDRSVLLTTAVTLAGVLGVVLCGVRSRAGRAHPRPRTP